MPSDLYPRAVGDPELARWETLARRIVIGAALAAAALLGLGMALSYAGLRSAYVGAGFVAWAASAAPLTVDLLTGLAYVALLVLAGKAYPSMVLLVGVLASAGAQGYHLAHGGVDAQITDGRVIFALGASCMVFAGLAGHLLWKILERALPADFITAMRGTPTPDKPMTENRPRLAEVAGQRRAVGDNGGDIREDNVFRHLPPPPPPVALVKPAAGTRAAERTRSARPEVTVKTPPSQQSGPCHPDCAHHAGRGDVSKSARYRCVATLNGRKTGVDACQPCLKAKGEGDRS